MPAVAACDRETVRFLGMPLNFNAAEREGIRKVSPLASPSRGSHRPFSNEKTAHICTPSSLCMAKFLQVDATSRAVGSLLARMTRTSTPRCRLCGVEQNEVQNETCWLRKFYYFCRSMSSCSRLRESRGPVVQPAATNAHDCINMRHAGCIEGGSLLLNAFPSHRRRRDRRAVQRRLTSLPNSRKKIHRAGAGDATVHAFICA